MALRDQIGAAMREALKARDQKRLAALRLMVAAIQERAIAARNENLSDEDVVSVLARLVKQREDSAAAYESAGRAEQAAAERDEIAVIREFMPRQLSEDEIRAAVAEAVAATAAASPKDMGKVMAALKERHAGRMDLGKAGAIAKELLARPKA